MDNGTVSTIGPLPGEPVTGAELTELALAADPNAALDPDARPYDYFVRPPVGLLPQWYMPQVAIGRCTGWRVPVALAVVAALVVLEALGLCSVFGQVVIG